MNFSDIGKTFGVFLTNIDKIIYDDNWLLKAKIFSDLHLCDNPAGLKIMVEVFDQINKQLGDEKKENSTWQLTKFDYAVRVGMQVVKLQVVKLDFECFDGTTATATVYIREQSFSTEVAVNRQGYIRNMWSTTGLASACISTNCSNDNKYASYDDISPSIIVPGNDVSSTSTTSSNTLTYSNTLQYPDLVTDRDTNTVFKLIDSNAASYYGTNGS